MWCVSSNDVETITSEAKQYYLTRLYTKRTSIDPKMLVNIFKIFKDLIRISPFFAIEHENYCMYFISKQKINIIQLNFIGKENCLKILGDKSDSVSIKLC